MDSITIGWNKQTPGKVKFGSRKEPVQNPIIHKTIPKRPKQSPQNATNIPMAFTESNRGTHQAYPYTLFAKPDTISKSSNDTVSDIEVYHGRRLCSSRAAVATFVISVLIILVSALSIGIAFALIKPSTSSSNGSNGNSNQNSYTTITSGSVTSSISIGSQSGPPCSSYTEINDPTRSINQIGLVSSCDNGPIFNTSNGGAWIRFVGSGGTTIPISPVDINHCGGYLAGYFNDSLPTAGSPIVNASVCFDSGSIECVFSVEISVQYCSASYYIYFLPPVPVCSARYCTT